MCSPPLALHGGPSWSVNVACSVGQTLPSAFTACPFVLDRGLESQRRLAWVSPVRMGGMPGPSCLEGPFCWSGASCGSASTYLHSEEPGRLFAPLCQEQHDRGRSREAGSNQQGCPGAVCVAWGDVPGVGRASLVWVPGLGFILAFQFADAT